MTQYWRIKLLDSPGLPPQREWKISQDIITLGRLEENDCCISNDLKISSVHTRIKFDGENLQVDDLNSTNGTYIRESEEFHRIEGKADCPNPVILKVGASTLSIEFHYEVLKNSKIHIQNWQNTLGGDLNTPSQIETLLVLDICKSTETANIHGDNKAFYMKTRLEEITESVFKKHPPQFLKSTGDGFFATYDTSEIALQAARILLQRLEYRNKKTEQLPINVRMALHHGKTYIIDKATGDRHSNALNITFKIEGVKGRDFITPVGAELPEKNRIIATGDFLASLNENRSLFFNLGPYQIRGVETPIELYLFKEAYINTQH